MLDALIDATNRGEEKSVDRLLKAIRKSRKDMQHVTLHPSTQKLLERAVSDKKFDAVRGDFNSLLEIMREVVKNAVSDKKFDAVRGDFNSLLEIMREVVKNAVSDKRSDEDTSHSNRQLEIIGGVVKKVEKQDQIISNLSDANKNLMISQDRLGRLAGDSIGEGSRRLTSTNTLRILNETLTRFNAHMAHRAEQDGIDRRIGRDAISDQLVEAVKSAQISSVIEEVNLGLDSKELAKNMTKLQIDPNTLLSVKGVDLLVTAQNKTLAELRDGRIFNALIKIDNTLIEKLQQGGGVVPIPMNSGRSPGISVNNTGVRNDRVNERDTR
jgi:hypothetical protein